MRFLFIFAHPDDESFSSGGTIASLVKKGHTVKLITATKGEMGMRGEPPVCTQEDLGKVRAEEHRNASKILGISEIFYLDMMDGSLPKVGLESISKQILEILKREDPDAVITFDKEGLSRHPDHIQIHKAATLAYELYMTKSNNKVSLYYTALPQSLLRQEMKEGIDYHAYGKLSGTIDEDITTVVDITSSMDLKIKAIKCHKTQKRDWENYLKGKNFPAFKLEHFVLKEGEAKIKISVCR